MAAMPLVHLRHLRLWCTGCILLVLSCPAATQSWPAIPRHATALHMPDMTQAVQRAIQQHPTIIEAASALAAQLTQVNAATSGYYPHISAGAQSGYQHDIDGQRRQQSIGLYASQTLYDFGKTASSVRTEEAGVAHREAALLLAIDQISQQTALAVVEVQRHQHMLRAAHLQLDNLAQIASLAEERHLQGASARSDVVQSAARIETVKGSLLHYQAQLDRWLTRLATLLGQQQLSGVTDAFPQAANNACTAPPGDTLVTPAVNIAQAQYQKANAQLAHAQAQLRPTISLDPSATRQLNTSSVQRGDTQRTQYSIFIQLKMPLYQGGYLDAQKQAAMHALHAATASLQHARFSARQQLLEAVSQIASLERTQAVIVQRHRLNTDTRDLYRQQYQALGNRALLDLLNAEQEIFQSDIDSHNLNAELHQLLLQCLTSTSTLRTVFGLDALINIHRGQIP